MPFRRAPNCATGPLWWSARTPDPSTRIASTKRRALRVSRHLIPEPKQFARYDRHAGCAVQSLEASPSWQALQPAGLSGGDARATATRSAGGPPPLGSGRRRASSRSACPAFVPAEHANGYSRASRLFGTDARLSFLRNGERSFVWGSTDYAGMPGWDQTLTNQSGAPVILRGRHSRSSEGKREGLIHNPGWPRSSADPAKEISSSSGCPQDFHASSTGFPQMGLLRILRSAPAPGR